LRRTWRPGTAAHGSRYLWILYAPAPNFAALFAASIVGAPIVGVFALVQSSYHLWITPDELRGRVNSVFRPVTVGMEPLSITLTGALLQAIGGVTTILVAVVPQVVLAALTTFILRMSRVDPACE